ncbi:hypothetical protein AVV36_gp119 [Pectobacterium bacteriophage PM2]|uniref:Uncharacterized protein n=1 Tax=Pectobacterium bacteriophage PM2 TaxID=1429794 RepID=A0A0A0Q0F0_9CAUD|nr:hypothetical protein AVV36_gp119 [Pectobacterium bacteriophage PM2]AHY25081.1 hypothetical protein PM2_119 [Pectobacterium bacteriophage PM2]
MITPIQAKIIKNLVQDIEDKMLDVESESWGDGYGLDKAIEDLKESKINLDQYLKSITA